MKYEGNRKHKEPWQRGKSGSLCPEEINIDLAQRLLDQSVMVVKKRFAFYNGRAFCAHSHSRDRWHGFPIGWEEVPQVLRNKWRKEGSITREDIRKFWK